MRIIVGLGNPGTKYENTRHNLGFMVLDQLLKDLTPVKETFWESSKNLESLITKLNFKGEKILLVKPQTMINASGIAVKKIISSYQKLPNYQLPITNYLIVIHDELDLPLGKFKIVKGRGAAGHRGVGSIIKEIGTKDFVRFRVGIGRLASDERKWEVGVGRLVHKNVPSREVEDFVLSEFEEKEKPMVADMVRKVSEAICFALEVGIEKAREKYNI